MGGSIGATLVIFQGEVTVRVSVTFCGQNRKIRVGMSGFEMLCAYSAKLIGGEGIEKNTPENQSAFKIQA